VPGDTFFGRASTIDRFPIQLSNSQSQQSALSRRKAPELLRKITLEKTEGAGKAGCQLHPQPRMQNEISIRA
jgi:hypothetical protein